jgi:hypothetical protein
MLHKNNIEALNNILINKNEKFELMHSSTRL